MAVKHIKAMRLKNYQSRVYGLFPQKGCLFKKFGKLLSCLILFRRARPLSMLLCGRKSPFLVQGPLPFISRNFSLLCSERAARSFSRPYAVSLFKLLFFFHYLPCSLMLSGLSKCCCYHQLFDLSCQLFHVFLLFG